MQLPPEKMTSKTAFRWLDVFKILLALVLIVVILSKTSVSQVVEVLRGISWQWLMVSFALFWLMTALKAVQYWALLGFNKVPYSQIIKIVVFQNALSNLVTNSAGVASYFTLFRMEQEVTFKRSGIVFLITKVGDIFSIAVFLLFSTFLIWDRIGNLHQITIVLLVSMFTGLAVFVTIVILRAKFVSVIEQIMDGLHLRRHKFVQNALGLIRSLVEEEQSRFIRTLLLAGFLSMIYMTTTLLYTFSRIKVFHIPLDFWASAYMVSFVQIISLVPIQVLGGLGVTEFVTMFFFSLFGVTQIDIPATLIGRRVLTYLFYLISLLYTPFDMLLARRKAR